MGVGIIPVWGIPCACTGMAGQGRAKVRAGRLMGMWAMERAGGTGRQVRAAFDAAGCDCTCSCLLPAAIPNSQKSGLFARQLSCPQIQQVHLSVLFTFSMLADAPFSWFRTTHPPQFPTRPVRPVSACLQQAAARHPVSLSPRRLQTPIAVS
jgi:hypothetical protein